MISTILTRTRWTVWLIGLAFWASVSAGQESAQESRTERQVGDIVVERDAAKQTLRIQIPSKDRQVAWSDVCEALMRAGHLDDQAVRDKLPRGKLDLTRSSSRYALIAVNVLLKPEINLQIVPASRGVKEHLLITVDEAAVLAKRRELTKRMRDHITQEARKGQQGPFGLRLPANWEQTDPRQIVVIIVHGFNSSPGRFEPLANALRTSGMVAGTYNYPDDQPIATSAQQLSRDLKEMAAAHPERCVALVAHSMGGLVCRVVMEDPPLDPGNVRRLIMVAPPNQGSLLARAAFGMDLLDHAMPEAGRADVSRFYAAIEDGLAEAALDLRPESTFLHELNARERNPKVQYTIFLGTGGHFTRGQVDELRTYLAAAKAKSKVVEMLAARVDETLADLDEVIHGLGDGVVAVKRGKLPGVDDTVILEFTHLGVLQQAAAVESDPLYPLVLERLKR
jgi:pimeloyl-ACP methyl ester carboxylesterase